MSYVEELNTRVVLELTEILFYCYTCESRVLELLKVANCIFDHDEFFDVINTFTTFKSNMEILENLITQVDENISMLQIITVKSMVNQLRKDFDGLFEILEDADWRIENDDIDFEAASMLNDLLDKIEFDIADFASFETALSARYFISYLLESDDERYDPRYGGLKVLLIEVFQTKRAAYAYALKNGIAKDMVWSMYS